MKNPFLNSWWKFSLLFLVTLLFLITLKVVLSGLLSEVTFWSLLKSLGLLSFCSISFGLLAALWEKYTETNV